MSDPLPQRNMNNSGSSEVKRVPAGVRLAQVSDDWKARDAGDASARRALNALSVTGNLVSALIAHPGANGDYKSTVQAAQQMLTTSDSTTKSLVEKLDLKNISWAPYRVMKIVSKAISDRWSFSAKAGEASVDVSDLIPVWEEIGKYNLPEISFDAPAEDHGIALRIALLEAMQPTMNVISIFDMFHDSSKAAKHARDVILVTTQRALASLTGEPMNDRSKSLLMQALMRNAGDLYANCWKKESEETIDRLQQMTKAQRLALVEQYPSGLPLEKIDESFTQSFLKLVEMVQYLTVTQDPQQKVSDEMPSQYEDSAADVDMSEDVKLNTHGRGNE